MINQLIKKFDNLKSSRRDFLNIIIKVIEKATLLLPLFSLIIPKVSYSDNSKLLGPPKNFGISTSDNIEDNPNKLENNKSFSTNSKIEKKNEKIVEKEEGKKDRKENKNLEYVNEKEQTYKIISQKEIDKDLDNLWKALSLNENLYNMKVPLEIQKIQRKNFEDALEKFIKAQGYIIFP